eukprot:scaffold37165_cov89-Cyclotella_meneghiniana.AAC.2
MIQNSSMSLAMPRETILVVGTDIPSLASAVEIDTKLSRKLPLCSYWGSECDFVGWLWRYTHPRGSANKFSALFLIDEGVTGQCMSSKEYGTSKNLNNKGIWSGLVTILPRGTKPEAMLINPS